MVDCDLILGMGDPELYIGSCDLSRHSNHTAHSRWPAAFSVAVFPCHQLLDCHATRHVQGFSDDADRRR